MILSTDLIVLTSASGVSKAYTRFELEELAAAGVLPSSLGAEDPERLTCLENQDEEDEDYEFCFTRIAPYESN